MSDVPSTLQNGRYELQQVIGVGGMSTVHLAKDTRMGVNRAVKILKRPFTNSQQIRDRFEVEAHAQARLRHPNILMVHDVHADDDGLWMVMELAEQGSLADQVRHTGPLSPQETAQVGITMCGALQVAHDNQVVHRDIKPENMLRDHLGVLKLADFGIARVLDRENSWTKTGTTMGTFAYMPPEQRNSAKSVDGRADIYAVGASLYFLATGREPFDLHNTESYGEAYAGFEGPLVEVIQKATRFYADDRYLTCEAMAQALSGLLDQLSDRALEGPSGRSLSQPLPSLETMDQSLARLAPKDHTVAPAQGVAPDAPTDLASERETVPWEGETQAPASTMVPDELLADGLFDQRPDPDAATLVTPELTDEGDPLEPTHSRTPLVIAAVASLAMGAWILRPGPSVEEPVVFEPPKMQQHPQEPMAVPEVEPEPVEAEPEVAPPKVVAPEATAAPVPKATVAKTNTQPKAATVEPILPEPVALPDPVPEAEPIADTKGKLGMVINTDPAGAKVYIDGDYLGKADRKPIFLTPGQHSVKLKDELGQTHEVDVEVKDGTNNYYCWSFETFKEC